MPRWVKVEDSRTSRFLPGEVVGKFRFRQANDLLSQSLRIEEPGGHPVQAGDVALQSELKETIEGAEAAGRARASSRPPAFRRPPRGAVPDRHVNRWVVEQADQDRHRCLQRDIHQRIEGRPEFRRAVADIMGLRLTVDPEPERSRYAGIAGHHEFVEL